MSLKSPERRTRTPVQSVRDRKLNNPSLGARKRKKRINERLSRWRGEVGDHSELDEELEDSEHLNRVKVSG